MKKAKISLLSLSLLMVGFSMAHAIKVKGVFTKTGEGTGWVSWHCKGEQGWCMKKNGNG